MLVKRVPGHILIHLDYTLLIVEDWTSSLQAIHARSGFPQKSRKKSSMIFLWLFQAKILISRQKISIFVSVAHVSICRINYRHTQAHTHTQTHTWFDQGQPTIQLILLVIELIQEVKTTLVNPIKMGNRFSYWHLKNDVDFSFPYRLYI